MEARVGVSKIGKYATPESGDSLEMIERPSGGLSFVLVDGQRSGRAAKAISNVVARKAIGLLADGVRDGPAARAASDYLYTYRSGKVQATLNILSIDLQTNSLVITRNSPEPVLLVQDEELRTVTEESEAVGSRRGIRPSISEVPISVGLTAIIFTDGLSHAGERNGRRMDIPGAVRELLQDGPPDPQSWADALVRQAVALDSGRPDDDISVLVAAILAHNGDESRSLAVRVPLV
jgi:hypothetical protein